MIKYNYQSNTGDIPTVGSDSGCISYIITAGAPYHFFARKIILLRVIPTMTFIHFLTGKSSGILSDISSDILFDILSGISSGI